MTGGRPRLPGPLTSDAVGRLFALSPGGRVTWCLPCRALRSQRSAGADVSAYIRAGQMMVCSIYTPHGDRHLSSARQAFLRLSVAVTPLLRYTCPDPGPARPAPAWPASASGLAAVRRAVPQVAERRLRLASGLAVAQVLERLPGLTSRL